jgi:hypothetical protein
VVVVATIAQHCSRRLGHLADEHRLLEIELAEIRRLGPSGAAVTPQADFVVRLPMSTSVDALVRDVQRASGPLGVVFVSLSAVERVPTAQALGRLESRLILRGPYGGVKAVLAEAFARQQGAAVLHRLVLRQLSQPAELEAQADLILLARPLSADARS